MAKYSSEAIAKIAKVMGEYKSGGLHSGGSGKVVTDPAQAKAIALSEAKRRGYKVPKKKKKMASGGMKFSNEAVARLNSRLNS